MGQRFSQSLYYNADGLNATKCYNGNISSMTWKSGNESTLRSYVFTYDLRNRLQDAVYGEGSSGWSNLNGFTEQVTGYDKNGNILELKRYGQTGSGTYGLIDNLTITLNGNQLKTVNDAVTTAAYNSGFEFNDGSKVATEYAYDLNGNLTEDLNKNINNIQYNCLNLPGQVTFSDESTITYTYDADGVKLRAVHKIGGTTTTKDYCGNVIYENGTAKCLLTEGGYLSLGDKKYHYYLQDHQGNNRVVALPDGSVEETNHYYPFGGVFASTGNVQAYKYNGKELDAKKGLNWYDYGARMYDPALGRWHTVDPSSEKYYGVGPYAYCDNTPVKNVDLDGRDWYLHRETGELYFNSSMNQEEIEYNNRSYARIGGNDMLGDMQDITEKAYKFDESSSLAENNGYSINPTQEIKSEVSREQPYSTGKKTITVTTGEVEIINEQYGIFPANKTRRISVKTNSLFTKKVSKMDILDGILTGSKKTDEIKRNYYTYGTSTSGNEAQRVLGNIYGVAETIMTGKHDYRNVTIYKDWNAYSKAHKGNGRMLKYRR
ncbi:RHS repeat domain-containing protein [Bacteroides timonensis]|uniref:RHS repeat domain-containing protein n=1 Tax=Bacteroides timonensis TaxID=1470345 RepID=UPI0004ADE3ED|nr:RHS repeat-associated core domain-containing protein [Bacteroides timonensis]